MGYADWDRVVRRGTEQISSATWTPGNSDFTLPIDVRPFEAVAFVPLAINGLSLTEIDWLATDNPDSYVSYENLVLDGNIVNQTAIIFPCLTSFMALRANVLLSASAGTLAVYGLVRSLPVRSIPTSYSQSLGDLVVPPYALETFYPKDYLTGRAVMTGVSTGAGGRIDLHTFDNALTDYVFMVLALPDNVWQTFDIVLPMSAWYIQLANGNAQQQTMEAYVAMSPTGA